MQMALRESALHGLWSYWDGIFEPEVSLAHSLSKVPLYILYTFAPQDSGHAVYNEITAHTVFLATLFRFFFK